MRQVASEEMILNIHKYIVKFCPSVIWKHLIKVSKLITQKGIEINRL